MATMLIKDWNLEGGPLGGVRGGLRDGLGGVRGGLRDGLDDEGSMPDLARSSWPLLHATPTHEHARRGDWNLESRLTRSRFRGMSQALPVTRKLPGFVFACAFVFSIPAGSMT